LALSADAGLRFVARRVCEEHRGLLVEPLEVERLVDELICPEERTRCLVEAVADAREHQHARMSQGGVLADLSAHLPAAHPGHHHVEHD